MLQNQSPVFIFKLHVWYATLRSNENWWHRLEWHELGPYLWSCDRPPCVGKYYKTCDSKVQSFSKSLTYNKFKAKILFKYYNVWYRGSCDHCHLPLSIKPSVYASIRFLAITATNRNNQNLNCHKPKRPQTGTSKKRNGHKPERPQTGTATNKNGHNYLIQLASKLCAR